MGRCFVAVLVDEAVVLLLSTVSRYSSTASTPLEVCIQPASLVEALVDEELAPGDGSVGVEALVARHLKFGAEEEGGVGIDEEESVMVGRVGGRDGHAVGAGGLWRIAVVNVGYFVAGGDGVARRGLRRDCAVEGLELGQVDAFDVAADAAFGEGQGHPRLEVLNDARLYSGVFVEIEVQAVGEGVHQGA